MTGQAVTAADLEYPWNCEGCGREFAVGDEAFGEVVGMTVDTPSVENWRCIGCQEAAA